MLLDVLYGIHEVAELDQAGADLPDFAPVCTRKRYLETRLWRVLLQSSAGLHDLGHVYALNTTGTDRIAAGQHCAKPTNAHP